MTKKEILCKECNKPMIQSQFCKDRWVCPDDKCRIIVEFLKDDTKEVVGKADPKE